MEIKGLQKTTLIDYPDNIASIIFIGKCNFRCPFCYNKDLVLNPEKLETIPLEEVIEFLKKRKKVLDGVVISGGEPCMNKDLPELIKKIKELGYLIKLDTNGSCPETLKELIEKKLIDYIAMDIKSSLDIYDEVAGVKVDKEKIKESVGIIINSGLNYEFRTTVLKNFYTEEEAEKIGMLLKGAKKYCLQEFKAMDSLLDPGFKEKKSLSIGEMRELKKILEKNIKSVEIR